MSLNRSVHLLGAGYQGPVVLQRPESQTVDEGGAADFCLQLESPADTGKFVSMVKEVSQ